MSKSDNKDMEGGKESADATENSSVSYAVNIEMSEQTVGRLQAINSSLLGFKAVNGPTIPGAPLVWFRMKNYSTDTSVTWTGKYQAYLSKTEIALGVLIVPYAEVDMLLGQTLLVNDVGHIVENQGAPESISIANESSEAFTCGMSQYYLNQGASERIAPICAFKGLVNTVDAFTPVERILLTFQQTAAIANTVITVALGPSLLIELGPPPDNHRIVSFDFNEGWQWGGAPWAQAVEEGTDIMPLLINPV